MKYPKLVRPAECKTDVEVFIYSDDIDEDGAPVTNRSLKTKCNYQSNSRKFYDDKKQLIDINAVILFSENIFEDIEEIQSGYVKIFDKTMDIIKCNKCRNPDGTVNYVRLYLK